MKVLVTGAHGFVGSHLVKKLLAEGASVRALVSPWGQLDNLAGVEGRLELVRADISRADTLAGIFNGVELVYHAAAKVADYGPERAFWNVNVKGTENVLREAERAGVGRLVLVSSVAVHRYSGFRDADPRLRPRDGTLNAYARSKIAAEDSLADAALETVIVRPGLWPFGPRDSNFVRVAGALKKGLFPLVDGGKAVLNTAYSENLVDGLWLAGTVSNAANRTYVLADRGAPSWNALLGELAQLLHAPKPRLSLPGALSEPLGETVERVYGLLGVGSEPPLTRYRGALMRRDVHFSVAAAEQELGYRPRISWQEGLARTVAAL